MPTVYNSTTTATNQYHTTECCNCGSNSTELHDTCHRCVNCCQCQLCDACGQSKPSCSLCQLCFHCADCCTCILCQHCARPHSHASMLCPQCHRGLHLSCKCCHTNARLNKVRAGVNLARYTPTLEQLRQNHSPRLISVELEIAGLNCNNQVLQATLAHWHCSIVADGSLPSSGCEINTHPAGGDVFLEQIEAICTAFTQTNTRITPACGGHIHIDTRDYDYTAMARLVRLYACTENILYKMIPYNRRSSRYCVPWAINYLTGIRDVEKRMQKEVGARKRMLLYRQALLTKLYGFTDKKAVKAAHTNKTAPVNGGSRYRAFNLQSWMYRGTVEFRFPPGTVNALNCTSYAMLLANMIDVAFHNNMDEVMALVKDAETEIYENSKDTFYPPSTKQRELLLSLAPTPAIQEWIIERINWYKDSSHQLEAISPQHRLE